MDTTDGTGARAHHQGFRGGTGTAVTNALEDVAVGDARGGEKDVVAGAKVVCGENAVEVIASTERRFALAIVAWPETAEQLPPHRLQGRGGQHALWGSAD